MKPSEVHWAQKLYLSVEGYAKNLALVSAVVTPVYLLFSKDKVDFSFLETFSQKMESFSSLAGGALAFTDAENPIIVNLTALLTALAGMSKGVFVIAELASTTVIPFLQTANYAALLSSTLTVATSPLFLLIAGTAIGVCAISYWMSQGASEEVEVNEVIPELPILTTTPSVIVNVHLPKPDPLPLTTPTKTEFNIADIIKQLPSGASIEITTPDGIKMKIDIPLIEAAVNTSQVDKVAKRADINVELEEINR